MVSSFDIEREILNARVNTGEVKRLEALLDIKIREEKYEFENKKLENESQKLKLNAIRGIKL